MDANDHSDHNHSPLPLSPDGDSPGDQSPSTTDPPNAGANAANGGVTKRYRPAPAKTFQCRGFGECRMVFSRSEHLARHIRKHTGERPFSCHCGKQFSRLDNLRQHAQTVHSDKHTENEVMMRELTSLHTQLAARSSKLNRETMAVNPNDKQRAGTAGAVRPGTSTGYETYGVPPVPGAAAVPIPYPHQMPQYPPPPPGPTGYYAHPEHYPGYYPPPGMTPQQAYQNAVAYPPQYGHPGVAPYPGVHPVRYAPYPGAYGPPGSYPPPAGPGYGEAQTSSPGPHTPLTPSSAPASANSAGAGHSFLGPGQAASNQPAGSFLGQGNGATQTGSPNEPPIDPSIQQQGGGQSFRTNNGQHVSASPRSSYSGDERHANENGAAGSNGDGGFGGQHPSRESPIDGEPTADGTGNDSGYDGRSVGSGSTASVERGFHERGADSEPGFGDSNTASRNQHQQYRLQPIDPRPSPGFNGAAGRGEQPRRDSSGFGPSPTSDSSVGFEYGQQRYQQQHEQYSQDPETEISSASIESRRGPRPPGHSNSFHAEDSFTSQRSGQFQQRQQSGGQSFRGLRDTGRTSHSGSPGASVPVPATAKTGPVLPPIAAIVSDRPPSSQHQHGVPQRQPSFHPYGRDAPPGSSGGYSYLADAEFGRPGTAPAAYHGGPAAPRHAQSRDGFRVPPAGSGPERLGSDSGAFAGDRDRRLPPSRGGGREPAGGLGDRRHAAPNALPGGGFNSQFHFNQHKLSSDTSPTSESPFRFHPPDVPYHDESGGLNVPRPTSGRPFSGLSSVGRPSTATSVGAGAGRPASSYGYGYGVRPGTSTSTTDPASYAFSRGTKRPYTADSSDGGGSASGRESSFRRTLDQPASTVADDDARPASRRLSLMELCTPPATASGRPRTGNGWNSFGTLVGSGRPGTSDASSRFTGKTAVDEGPDYEPEPKLFSELGLTSRVSPAALEADDVKPQRQAFSSDVHPHADSVSRQSVSTTRTVDVSGGSARQQSGHESPRSEPIRRSDASSRDRFGVDEPSRGDLAKQTLSVDQRSRPSSRHSSASPFGFKAPPLSPGISGRDGHPPDSKLAPTRSQSVLPGVGGVAGDELRRDVYVLPESNSNSNEHALGRKSATASDDGHSPRLNVPGSTLNAATPRSSSASSPGSTRHGPNAGSGNELRAVVGDVRG